MAKIVSVHSFRRGRGKTNLIASLGVVMAAGGKRVGLVDTDFQSPSLHILFGIDEGQISRFLNDYVHQVCRVEEAALDLTARLGAAPTGSLFLVPSNPAPNAVTQIVGKDFDVDRLGAGYQSLVETLNLDVLLIDTQAGISGQSMASLAVSDAALIVFRLDQQDYQGTSVLIELAHSLGVGDVLLVVNDIATPYDLQSVKAETEATYEAEVGALIPHSEEMGTLGSHDVFAWVYTGHPLTTLFEELASRLL